MRKLITFLLIATSCFAQEIRRPTSDFDSGNATWAVSACGYAPNRTTSSGAFGWDAAGQATSVPYQIRGSFYTGLLASRTFSSWQAKTSNYSALTLNVNTSATGWANLSAGTGMSCILYSLDSGSTWATITCDISGAGWTQSTSSIVLTSTQDLSKIRVGVCLEGSSGGGSSALEGASNILVYDIWTTGTTSGSTTPGTSSNGNSHRGAVIVF